MRLYSSDATHYFNDQKEAFFDNPNGKYQQSQSAAMVKKGDGLRAMP